MAQRRFGVKQLMIDGVVHLAKSGCEYSLGGDKQDAEMGLDGFHGFKVSRYPASLKVTISDGGQGQTDLRALTRIRDSKIALDLENGKSIQLSHAAYTADGKVNAEAGEIDCEFMCDPNDAQEI